MRFTAGLGVRSVLDGLTRSVSQPRLRREVVRVLVLTALAFVAVVALLLYLAFGAVDLLIGDGGWFWTLIAITLKVAVVGVAVFVAPVVFSLAGSIVAPATNDRIFRVARQSEGASALGDGLSLGQSVGIEVRRLGRYVGLSFALLWVNLLPGVGPVVYVLLQALLSAWVLGWDILSGHLELHGMGWSEQRQFLRDHRVAVLSTGGAALGLCLVPVLGLLCLTTNQVGAGLLSARLDGGAARR